MILSFFVFFLLSVVLVKNIFGYKVSFLIALFKFSILFFYFNYFYDYSYGLPDAKIYYLKSLRLYEIFFEDGLPSLNRIINITGSYHFIYYLFVSTLFLIFSPSYYVPILANTAITFVSGLFLYKLLGLYDFSDQKKKNITLFYLISPDVICWSSFQNLRDTLISAVVLITLFNLQSIIKGFKIKNIILFLFSSAVLVFLRFYVCIILYISYILFKLFNRCNKTFDYIAIFILVILVVNLIIFFSGNLSAVHYSFEQFLPGFIRYFITPFPLNVSKEYYFIMPAALFHFVMLPFSLIGLGLMLKNKNFKFIFIFIILLGSFYALFPEIQGVRQRLQISFVFIIFQYEGVIYVKDILLKYMAKKGVCPSLIKFRT